MKTLMVALCMIMLGLAAPQLTQADAAVKQRMKERLPRIEALKAEQKVGENSDGYLTGFSDEAAVKALVEAENADRRKAYEEIAQRTGGSVEMVGRLRARQLRDLADPGEKVQDADGSWRVH